MSGIRIWAKENGFQVGNRGVISSDIWNAWAAAMGIPAESLPFPIEETTGKTATSKVPSESMLIRKWAAERGVPLAPKGRIPDLTYNAWATENNRPLRDTKAVPEKTAKDKPLSGAARADALVERMAMKDKPKGYSYVTDLKNMGEVTGTASRTASKSTSETSKETVVDSPVETVAAPAKAQPKTPAKRAAKPKASTSVKSSDPVAVEAGF